MQNDPNKTVAIFGYCADKLNKSVDDNPDMLASIDWQIYSVVAELCRQGYDTFLSGAEPGFDIMVSRCVIMLKECRRDIRLITVLPFKNCIECGFYDPDIAEEILRASDHIEIMAERYQPDIFRHRTDFMVAYSSKMISYNTGLCGNTHYAMTCAAEAGIPVINIAALCE